MSYAAGTIVYAKLKGYPWWPARVEVESTLPSNVLSKKPKGPKPIYGVRFYGTRDYGWFGNNDLRPFDKKEAEVSLQKMKSKKRDKMLERSIREALDPSSFEDPMDEDAEEEAATEDDVELEEESKKSNESFENDDDIEYDKKPKSRGKGIKKAKKLTSPKVPERRKKSPGSTKSKRKDRGYSSGDEETVSRSGKIGKKRRANEGSNMDKSSRHKKIDYTDDEMELDEPSPEERRKNSKDRGASRSEGSKSPGKSDNGSPAGEDENKQITTDDNSKMSKLDSEGQSRSTKSRQMKTPSAKLLHLRHKVQKLVLKNPEFEKLDKSKVDELFTEVENFPITIPLLKESKIGKVMRKIAELKIEPDSYNIVSRSENLIKKWKCLLEPSTQEGTEEEASPKMPQIEGESPQNEEAVKFEENNQAMKIEKDLDIKKEGQDHAEDNEGNITKEISSMDLDSVESRVEEEKRVTGDNVTNESLSAANSQGGPTNENEVLTKTEL